MIALDKRVPNFDKRRQIADLVEKELKERGQFCHTRDDRLFYLSHSEGRLLDLEQRPFEHLLKNLSGLGATEATFHFVRDWLRTLTAQASTVEVRTLSHYDAKTGLFAISDGGSGVWVRERGGEWRRSSNGANGLVFLTDAESDPWEPEFGSSQNKHLEWFVSRISFSDHGRISRDDQASLYAMNLYHWFFPPWRRTRMISAFLGAQGSGKSTGERLTGCLLVGPRFEVSDLRAGNEDAFIAAITNRIIYAVDNADSRISWLPDALARYATGHRYRMRRLRTTNETVSYEPTAMLVISSRDPHFTRGDVAERLLPLYCRRPSEFVPESVIFAELARRRGAIMGALLQKLGDIADRIGQIEPKPVEFRMADFASFVLRIAEAQGTTDSWLRRLKELTLVQADFASDGDGVISALRILLDHNGKIGPVEVGELYRQCAEVAGDEHFAIPGTVQGFGQRLTNLKQVIEVELDV